jgi:hypothetical protein
MRLALSVSCIVVAVSIAITTTSALAGPALDDDRSKRPPPPEPDEVDCKSNPDDVRCRALDPTEDAVEYGVGLRARSVWLPKAVLELFVTRAAGGAHNYGGGVELSRRRGSTELQLGFEYERINVGQGVWINKGDDVSAGDEADYVLGPGDSGKQLGWFTVELTFINHAELSKNFAVRYGGGLGLGIVTGQLDHYNIVCVNATNAAPEPGCVPMRYAGGLGMYSGGVQSPVKYDLPPVFPVVNAILGLQIRPTDKLTINLEGGIRTLPFFGISSSMFF